MAGWLTEKYTLSNRKQHGPTVLELASSELLSKNTIRHNRYFLALFKQTRAKATN
jgi:hypothetical protein